jgi:DNA polymerase I
VERYVEGNSGSEAATHIAVIFDAGSHTFRNDIYPLYKANREAMPEDLRPQFPLTRAPPAPSTSPASRADGFEADDIIATCPVRPARRGGGCTIISSDKDLMQLVGDGVEMLDPMKNPASTARGDRESSASPPERVVDVQALAGDSVDNVPGAPGIGIKTAALLIRNTAIWRTLLARAAEIKQPKRRER